VLPPRQRLWARPRPALPVRPLGRSPPGRADRTGPAVPRRGGARADNHSPRPGGIGGRVRSESELRDSRAYALPDAGVGGRLHRVAPGSTRALCDDYGAPLLADPRVM